MRSSRTFDADTTSWLDAPAKQRVAVALDELALVI